MPLPETFAATLVAARDLAPSVRGLAFERDDGRPVGHAPGQWVNLVLPLPSGEIRRAYSIASAADGSPRFDLAVTRVGGGLGSGYLCDLPVGARLSAVGPQGFFTREATSPHPALLVGTGTGVTPLRSMLLSAVAAGSPAPMCLLLGVRTEADRLYADELAALAAAHPNVRFETTLSRPSDAWTGRRGWVQAHVPDLLAELQAAGAGEPHLYVCGLERMVKAVRELARKQLGLPRERVHGERYD